MNWCSPSLHTKIFLLKIFQSYYSLLSQNLFVPVYMWNKSVILTSYGQMALVSLWISYFSVIKSSGTWFFLTCDNLSTINFPTDFYLISVFVFIFVSVYQLYWCSKTKTRQIKIKTKQNKNQASSPLLLSLIYLCI